jgi:Na+/melibiose symporter-like transporter
MEKEDLEAAIEKGVKKAMEERDKKKNLIGCLVTIISIILLIFMLKSCEKWMEEETKKMEKENKEYMKKLNKETDSLMKEIQKNWQRKK